MVRHCLYPIILSAALVSFSFGNNAVLPAAPGADAATAQLRASDSAAAKVSSTAVLFPVRRNGKFGYIDSTGKLVIDYRFESAEMFSDGLGMVRAGGKFGFVDAAGRYAIAPQFTAARPFAEGRSPVSSGPGFVLIDTTGGRIASLKYAVVGPFSEGRAPIVKGEDIGFIDREGRIVVEPKYESGGGPYAEGLAPAHLEGDEEKGHPDPAHEWGFVDLAGKIAFGARFRNAGAFSDGLAPVQVDRKWGYIDHSGQVIIPPQFYDAARFSGGLARIGEIDRSGYVHYGFIDQKGKVVIKPQFSLADHFSEGRAAVKVGNKWGYIDKQGKMVVQPQFYFAHAFQHGLGHVIRKTADSKQWDAYLNSSGQFIWGGPSPQRTIGKK